MHTKPTLAIYACIALHGKAGIALPYSTLPSNELHCATLLYITLHHIQIEVQTGRDA